MVFVDSFNYPEPLYSRTAGRIEIEGERAWIAIGWYAETRASGNPEKYSGTWKHYQGNIEGGVNILMGDWHYCCAYLPEVQNRLHTSLAIETFHIYIWALFLTPMNRCLLRKLANLGMRLLLLTIKAKNDLHQWQRKLRTCCRSCMKLIRRFQTKKQNRISKSR